MDSNEKLICQKERYILKNKKIYIKENNLEIKQFNKKNSFARYFNESELLNLNPFVKSIINFSALKLSSYKRKFRVFYQQKNSVKMNQIINFFFRENYVLNDWIENIKNNHILAFQLICDFINVNLVEVDNYEEADFIVSTFAEHLNFIGVGTSPHELDIYEILDGKIYIFYTYIPKEENTARGSFWFYSFMHHILHSLGLMHPESGKATSEPNLFNINSIYGTVMCSKHDVNNYPQTLMPLDIEALKFLYAVTESPRYRKWLNLSCPRNIIQSLTSEISLNLKQDKNHKIFNLSLDQINLSGSEITNLSVISRIANDKEGATILNNGCFIKEITVDYEELNIYASLFSSDVKIFAGGNNIKQINIYLQGKENEYIIIDEKRKITIIKKDLSNKIMVDSNYFTDVNIIVNILGDQVLENFPQNGLMKINENKIIKEEQPLVFNEESLYKVNTKENTRESIRENTRESIRENTKESQKESTREKKERLTNKITDKLTEVLTEKLTERLTDKITERLKEKLAKKIDQKTNDRKVKLKEKEIEKLTDKNEIEELSKNLTKRLSERTNDSITRREETIKVPLELEVENEMKSEIERDVEKIIENLNTNLKSFENENEIATDDIGSNIVQNLQEEHYFEIIDKFFSRYPEYSSQPTEKIIDLLNAYGINYISRRFKSKLKGKKFPLMTEMLEKKKNEFKNTSLIDNI